MGAVETYLRQEDEMESLRAQLAESSRRIERLKTRIAEMYGENDRLRRGDMRCQRCDERAKHPEYRPSQVRGMHWSKPADFELNCRGKGRASVWANGTWHTWDTSGTGGENATAATVEEAQRAAEAAIVRQGWGRFAKT
jgi:hypothetical protein